MHRGPSKSVPRLIGRAALVVSAALGLVFQAPAQPTAVPAQKAIQPVRPPAAPRALTTAPMVMTGFGAALRSDPMTMTGFAVTLTTPEIAMTGNGAQVAPVISPFAPATVPKK